jgi:hypothetical protein
MGISSHITRHHVNAVPRFQPRDGRVLGRRVAERRLRARGLSDFRGWASAGVAPRREIIPARLHRGLKPHGYRHRHR